jgi:triacylglycerol lipase
MQLHSTKPSDGITELDFLHRSLLFAELASIAYQDKKQAGALAKKLGFTTTKFYDRDGAQAYRFQNAKDCVIVCRGTEPTCWNDIKADLDAVPVMAETVSRVHRGFKGEVDDLWPMVVEDVRALKNQKLWFAGHSLGAAMATIMASRCHYDDSLKDPEELYTYGSPRVGWPKYVDNLGLTHHRWVNNNDIVCRVPLVIMGYRHHGEEHYMNAYGNIRKLTAWQRVKDRWRGMWMGLKEGRIDNFSDHNMSEYIANIAKGCKLT